LLIFNSLLNINVNKNFTFNLIIKEDELDALHHVNNVNYIRWVQTAAQKHWSSISNLILESKYVWVVLRHEIDYLASAKLGDKIQVITWVGDSYGVKSERFVEIKRREANFKSKNSLVFTR